MPRDLESLIDIQQAAQRIIRFTQGLSREALLNNEKEISALLYQITIIGEATKRLSKDFRERHPEIPWRNLAGMRDVLVHEYDQIDLDIVWDVVEQRIPELLQQLKPLVDAEIGGRRSPNIS
ncbi:MULTISPECIES: DUF86 domain-containing protein [Cyanophyceae]|uniref:HepT-like ribonuclease domain-containing protein n=1 Tax=Cyanophyceae TaxID=3028117 RepID=UPI00016DC3B3|nr:MULTISPECIES: DUF86 domain-containing protein [Cyanophyceae]ACB01073.1 conserved hypothetical protein [Picosynechococcus sp. PCC 7002]SMH47672.1 Uncharacterized conserved protein, contains HEPN domain [Picosynechococcus sp. OG1]SMQ81063.1 Uncharacterized conserved protein, contains HEPN domain [Synechococcus sp. 7002]